MNRVLLIDGDIFAYQAACSVQRVTEFDDEVAVTADKDEGIADLTDRLARLSVKLGADDTVIALSDPANFRKAILPTYKSNRKATAKPILLSFLRSFMLSTLDAKMKPGLEGDDVIGIMATNPKLYAGHEKIMVTIDKDLRTVPGIHFNPDKDTDVGFVDRGQGAYAHMMQTLTGDTTDGYIGCPGCGPVKAAKALAGQAGAVPMWAAVVATFEKAGLTAADALVQAQIARICQHSDYDYVNKRPIPWQPKAA